MRKALLLLALCGGLKAQIGTPIAGAIPFQFWDNSGVLLAGGKICSYQAGTSTPLLAYADPMLATPQSNPIVLDSSGRPTGGQGIYIGAQAYKFVARLGGDGTCSTGVIIWTRDYTTNGSSVMSFNGFTGAVTLIGTPNQVTVTNVTNVTTISLPSDLQIQQLTLLGTGSTLVLSSNGLDIDGNGNLSTANPASCAAGVCGNILAAGYVVTSTWLSTPTVAGTPATSPGGGYGALVYQGGSDGTKWWQYDPVVAHGWVTVDLAGGGGGAGVSSLNTLTGGLTLAVTSPVTLSTTGNTITVGCPGCGGSGGAVTSVNTFTGAVQVTATTPIVVTNTGPETINVSCPTCGTGPSGGVSSLNTFTGGVTISGSGLVSVTNLSGNISINCCSGGFVSSVTGTANEVYVNGFTGTPESGAVTLALPQAICVSCNVVFGQVAVQTLLAGPVEINSAGAVTGITGITMTGSLTMTGGGTISTTGLIDGSTLISTGIIAASSYYESGGYVGLNCSGTPSSSFSSVGGIVTHC